MASCAGVYWVSGGLFRVFLHPLLERNPVPIYQGKGNPLRFGDLVGRHHGRHLLKLVSPQAYLFTAALLLLSSTEGWSLNLEDKN